MKVGAIETSGPGILMAAGVTGDSYSWNGGSGGAWGSAANWIDTTTGADPATSAPGAGSLVSIGTGYATLPIAISGSGTCALLSLAADVTLAGGFSAGTLTMASYAAQLDLLAGDTLAVSGAVAIGAGDEVAIGGAGAALATQGVFTLGIGNAGAELSLSAGGVLRAGGFVAAGASYLAIDSASAIEVGGTTGAAAGSFTVDAGGTASLGGVLNAAALVVNGVLDVGTLALAVGGIGGTGTIDLNGSLDLQGGAGTAHGSGTALAFAPAATLEIGAGGQAEAASLSLQGFAAGDEIVWDGTVTATSFAHGTLSLLDAGTTVGTLHLAGITAAENFVAVPDGNAEQGTEIVVAGAGDTATAPAGTASADSYVWNGALSGSWDVAGNWTDRSSGADPAPAAPGAHDNVTINPVTGPFGPSGAASVISGHGAAASLTLVGSTVLDGSFAAASLNALTSATAGTFYLLAGDTLSVSGAASLGQFGTIALNGAGASLAIGGTLASGNAGFGYGAAALDLTGGASLTAAGLIAYTPTSIVIDQASTLAIGGGSYGGGSFGVAAGIGVVLDGTLTAATLALGGSLTVAAGDYLALAVGAWTGGGAIDLAGTLGLAPAPPSGGGTIAFTGNAGVLALTEAAGVEAVAGTLTGFAAGDAIDWNGTDLTGTAFSHGTLSLLTAAGTAASLVLSGHYAGDSFLVLPNTLYGGQEVVVAGQGDTSTAPAGTSAADSYLWQGGAVASWDVAGNWADSSAGQNPASLAPGANDLVTLGGGGAGLGVVSGIGNAASLTVAGSYLLYGQFDVGQLADSGADQLLSLEAGNTLSVTGAASIGYLDRVTVAGAEAVLSVGGTLTLGVASAFGGDSLAATGGARVTLGGLVANGDAALSVDQASAIEVGSAGHAPAGAFKIDQGASATLSGTLTAPMLVLNGTLIAEGFTLQAGGASGGGTISIASQFDAGSGLAGGTGLTVAFANAAGTLAVGAGALDGAQAFDPAIAGFAQGDVIDWQGTTPTSSLFANGTLSLLDNGATLASFVLGQLATGLAPLVVPVDPGQTDILAVGAGNTRTAPRGTRSPQSFSWTAGMVGSWDVAGNWYETSQNAAATLAPGTQDSVTVGTATTFYDLPQVVTGIGDAASLTVLGPTVLDGDFTTASFALGGQVFGTEASVSPGGTLAVSGATSLGLGETLAVDGATFSTASLTGTDGTLLATNGATVNLAAAGSLGLISVDAASSVELGSRAGFAAGSFVFQANAVGTLGGTILAPSVTISGQLTAADLTIEAGTLGGQGTITIDGTLAIAASSGTLTGGAGLGIGFGVDGALVLSPDVFAGGRFAPTLNGFGPGDAIFYDGALSGAVAQGGTLLLQDGGQTLGTLSLAAAPAGERFVVAPAVLGVAEVAAVGVGDTASAPAGTSSQDGYIWNGGYGGSWDAAASWSDVSAGQTPAAVAPGANDSVGLGSFAYDDGPTDVVSGAGAAASLSVIGNTELVGSIAAGSLGFVSEAVALTVGDGGALAVQGAAGIGFGDTLAVVGASFSDAGSLDVGNFLYGDAGSLFTVGTGASAVVAGLSVNGGAAVMVDATSSLAVGGATHVGAGTLAVAGGQLIGFGGASYGGGTLGAPVLALNGIIAGGGAIEANTLIGSGQIAIGGGDSMILANDGGIVAGGAGPAVAFVGAGGTLSLSPGVLTGSGSLVPAVIGFGGGNAIDWFGALTGASYAKGSGKLSLLDGATTVAVIKLVGGYAGEGFAVATGFDGNSVVTLSPGSGGGPSVAAPGTLQASVGVASAVGGISVQDATGVSYTAVLSDTLGALSANTAGSGGGGTISGSGSDTLVISGSLSQLNADLRTLSFLAGTAGSDQIAVSVNDGAGRVSDLAIAVGVSDMMAPAAKVAAAMPPFPRLAEATMRVPSVQDFMPHVWGHIV